MNDVQKEIQKLKALINQKQTTAIFSNKSNESTKLALSDTELYINDMTRKFSFTRAGVKNPVMIDPKNKTIENVEYLNGVKIEDITESAVAIDGIREIVEDHDKRIGEVEQFDERITDCEIKDVEQDVKIAEVEAKNVEQDNRIQEHDTKIVAHDDKIQEHDIKIVAHDDKIQEHDNRLAELEKAEGSTDIVNSLIHVIKEEALESISYKYDNSMPGYFRITFDPPITEEYFEEGEYNFIKLVLNNGHTFGKSIKKTKTESGYDVDLMGATLINGIYTWYHGYTDKKTKEVTVYTQHLIKPTLALKSTKLTTAIGESTKSIVLDNLLDTTVDGTEPLEVTCTYDNSMPGYFRIIFDPPITEENFVEGDRNFLECNLSNGSSFIFRYNKYKAGTGYGMDFGDGVLENGVYTRYHGETNAKTTNAIISCQFIKVNRSYRLSDDRLTEAIVESTVDLEEYTNPLNLSYTIKNIGNTVQFTFEDYVSHVFDYLEYGTYDIAEIVLGANPLLYQVDPINVTIYYTKDANGTLTFGYRENTGNLNKKCTISYNNGYGTVTRFITKNFLAFDFSSEMKYTTVKSTSFDISHFKQIQLETVSHSLLRDAIVNLIYPPGAIYISFESIRPETKFGGIWKQIKDRFLYCNSTGVGQTGGSKKITVANLPSHNHTFTGTKATGTFGNMHGKDQESWYSGPFSHGGEVSGKGGFNSSSDNDHYKVTWNYTPAGSISSTGSGTDYMPPYINVYAWQRIA